MVDPETRETRRLLSFLGAASAGVRPAAMPDKMLLESPERGVISVRAEQLIELARRGVVARTASMIRLTKDGAALLHRLSSDEPYQDQHRQLESESILLPDGPARVVINANESPLAQLARRRDKSGSPFLTEAEFRAGERLRSDYTRGNIMPRLGANWVASVASGRRGAAGGSMVDLTDAALAARQRVEQAVEAVGPELAGVLIDICCFLKGIETVEMERKWPARSAKIVLKTALCALSRHYEPQSRLGRTPSLHWGATDYRPSIS